MTDRVDHRIARIHHEGDGVAKPARNTRPVLHRLILLAGVEAPDPGGRSEIGTGILSLATDARGADVDENPAAGIERQRVCGNRTARQPGNDGVDSLEWDQRNGREPIMKNLEFVKASCRE